MPEYALKLRRGPLSAVPTLAAGELAATNDAYRLLFGDGTTNHVLGVKHNVGASAAPTTGDDSADGYSPGSLWIDTTNDLAYICLDATAGAAVWQVIGSVSSAPASGAVPNVLHNGGFDVWQRGTSTSGNDDTYTADRWYQLTETATAQGSRQAGTLGARYALRLQNSAGGTQRIGIASIAEACDAIPYRGRSVRFQFKAQASTSTAIRFAILEWTGTADSVTSDVVNTWSSTTYTAGNFFLGANLTVVAVGSGTATTSFGSFSVTGTVSSSCNNLIVFVWTESAIAVSGNITLTECGLYDGTGARDWLPRSVAEEIALCQRYFYKSYDLDTTPGTATDTGAVGYAAAGTAGEYGPTITYPVRMRATPVYTIYSTATGTASRRRNASDGVDETVSAFNLSGPGSHSGMNLAHGAGKVYRYHFTASADL